MSSASTASCAGPRGHGGTTACPPLPGQCSHPCLFHFDLRLGARQAPPCPGGHWPCLQPLQAPPGPGGQEEGDGVWSRPGQCAPRAGPSHLKETAGFWKQVIQELQHTVAPSSPPVVPPQLTLWGRRPAPEKCQRGPADAMRGFWPACQLLEMGQAALARKQLSEKVFFLRDNVPTWK